MEGRPELIAMLREEIAKRGPVPFRRFMEAALYHPEFGYYRAASPVGNQGDFYTSVSVGPLFGRLMGLQFRQMWENLGAPDSILLVEQGADRGFFLKDTLDWAREKAPAFFKALHVGIVEPSDRLFERQAETLGEYRSKLGRCRDAAGFSGLEGAPRPVPNALFFSNELPDSFPVHRIVRNGGRWEEFHVDWLGERFGWTPLPLSSPELAAATAELPDGIPEGYVTEINLDARRWIGRVAGAFERGYVLTVDYGYPADAYYSPERNEGTLTAYREHNRSGDPEDLLDAVGLQDLTAHVDFTALSRAGTAAGLSTLGFTDQHHFLVGLLQGLPEAAEIAQEAGRAFQTLMHPEIMGITFKCLVQAKDAPAAPIAGLSFARSGALDC